MKQIILLIIALTLSACSSEHESPSLELNIERGDLTVAEIAGMSAQNSEATRHNSEVAHELRNLSNGLNNAVARFTL